MASLAGRQRAAKQVIYQEQPFRYWIVLLSTGLQALTFLNIIGFFAWLPTYWAGVLPMLAACFGVATIRAGSPLVPLLRPLTLAFAEDFSAFGVGHKQRSAGWFTLWITMLPIFAIGVGGAAINATVNAGIPTNWHLPNSKGCDGDPAVPGWLQASCMSFNITTFKRCQADLPPWATGTCQEMAARQGLHEVEHGPPTFMQVLSSSMVKVVIIAPWLAWALLVIMTLVRLASACCCCPGTSPCAASLDKDLQRRIDDKAAQIDQMAAEGDIQWGYFEKALFALELAFFLIDAMVLDWLCIYQYVMTRNYGFAIAQGCIYALALAQQVRHGTGPRTFMKEVVESYSRHLETDTYCRLMRDEKGIEGFLTFLLQYRTFLYVTSDASAVITFAFSLMNSWRGVTMTAFQLFHLSPQSDDIDDEALLEADPRQLVVGE